MTARLIAPMITGLRSRKGFIALLPGSPRGPVGVPAKLRPRGAKRLHDRTSWGDKSAPLGVAPLQSFVGWSSEITPCGAGVVGDRDRQPGQLDLALELAEVEVEPGAVDRRPADLGELD